MNKKNMSDKKHWLTTIVPVLAFATGIIMVSVGGMITLSSTAKLALFEQGPYAYIDSEQCRVDYNIPETLSESDTSSEKINEPRVRTEQEIEQCVQNKKMEEISRFQNTEKQDIVDGLSALIVGFLLIVVFRKKK